MIVVAFLARDHTWFISRFGRSNFIGGSGLHFSETLPW
jgi:hypothetical protein